MWSTATAPFGRCWQGHLACISGSRSLTSFSFPAIAAAAAIAGPQKVPGLVWVTLCVSLASHKDLTHQMGSTLRALEEQGPNKGKVSCDFCIYRVYFCLRMLFRWQIDWTLQRTSHACLPSRNCDWRWQHIAPTKSSDNVMLFHMLEVFEWKCRHMSCNLRWTWKDYIKDAGNRDLCPAASSDLGSCPSTWNSPARASRTLPCFKRQRNRR